MKKFHLMEVRVLSINEIAERLAAESGIERAVLERELRISVLNRKRYLEGLGPMPVIPPEQEWPDATELIDHDHMYWFCKKQGNWPLPEFWFGEQPKEKGKPGRPPFDRGAIVQEYLRRKRDGQKMQLVSDEAKALKRWLSLVSPDQKCPSSGTIENWIRALEKEQQGRPQN